MRFSVESLSIAIADLKKKGEITSRGRGPGVRWRVIRNEGPRRHRSVGYRFIRHLMLEFFLAAMTLGRKRLQVFVGALQVVERAFLVLQLDT